MVHFYFKLILAGRAGGCPETMDSPSGESEVVKLYGNHAAKRTLGSLVKIRSPTASEGEPQRVRSRSSGRQ